jgi:3-hydroxyacyl-CoA dehydrogenase
MDVKKAVFAELDAVARPDAILASNTSYLDIDEIAATRRTPRASSACTSSPPPM